jgi:hypothetical protein
MVSAIRFGGACLQNKNGFIPTGAGEVGSITTTSFVRFSGIRASMSFIKSDLGSITKQPRPALISAIMRLSITVLLPLPVAPRITVCSRESLIGIFSVCGLAPRLVAKLRLLLPLYHLGGRISLGCKPSTPANSESVQGSSTNPANSATDKRCGNNSGSFGRFSLAGFIAENIRYTPLF